MRVSNLMIFDGAAASADAASAQVQTAETIASSGLAFETPGQDPAAAGDAILTQASAARFGAISNNVANATAALQTADGALSTMQTALQQAQTLAEELANGNYNASDRSNAVPQVQGIISTIIGALNTQQGSQYVFGGTADTSAPFSSTGTFTGNDQSLSIEIAPGIHQAVSVPVGDLMTGTNGGANILGTLQQLQTALTNNNVAGIQTALDGIQSGITGLSTAQASAGSMISILSAASTASQSAEEAATANLSSLTNADEIQASTNLNEAQTALQAALDGASQTMKMFLSNQLGG